MNPYISSAHAPLPEEPLVDGGLERDVPLAEVGAHDNQQLVEQVGEQDGQRRAPEPQVTDRVGEDVKQDEIPLIA